MPIYTYKCIECETTFEKLAKIDDRDEQKCPQGHKLTRTIDRPGGVYAPTSTGGTLRV